MRILLLAASLAAAAPGPVSAQPVAPTTARNETITVEHYYRIRWGSATEFKRLYERNHAPVLREMQRQGFILALRTDEPFTHMAGGPRWDLRVTITYRDAASAIVTGGAFDQAFEAAEARLFPDRAAHSAEETSRFAMLEDHWDVIVKEVRPAS